MAIRKVLSTLQGRLFDLWFGGLLECQPLVSVPQKISRGNCLAVGKTLLAVPINSWEYTLVSHRSHPLQRLTSISPDDLAQYSLPALPFDVASQLNHPFDKHSFANCSYGDSFFNSRHWEEIATDRQSLAVVPPYRLPELESRLGLLPVRYSLGIQQTMALVGHRDVITESCFVKTLEILSEIIYKSAMGHCSEVRWHV
jgi:hypothetical protein